MSQPRRRRRRRRRPAAAPEGSSEQQQPKARESSTTADGVRRSRRRRRGRSSHKSAEAASPRSSEDLVRGLGRGPRVATTIEPDGRTLEGVIGELQSVWGVPQHPQEYRITLKVAEEREARGERVHALEEVKEDPLPAESNGHSRREKAPAAPRIGAAATDTSSEEATPARRKRSRRRRRKGSGGV
ncbi:MAG: hypothetical protein ABR529_03970 [Actinomycetota bacterium]